jgi:hypothetical protein
VSSEATVAVRNESLSLAPMMEYTDRCVYGVLSVSS